MLESWLKRWLVMEQTFQNNTKIMQKDYIQCCQNMTSMNVRPELIILLLQATINLFILF